MEQIMFNEKMGINLDNERCSCNKKHVKMVLYDECPCFQLYFGDGDVVTYDGSNILIKEGEQK